MPRWDRVFREFRAESLAEPTTRANAEMNHFIVVGDLYVGLTLNK